MDEFRAGEDDGGDELGPRERRLRRGARRELRRAGASSSRFSLCFNTSSDMGSSMLSWGGLLPSGHQYGELKTAAAS